MFTNDFGGCQMNRSFDRKSWFSGLAVVVLLAGCDSVDPPAFRMNMVEAVSYETVPEYQQEIANVLAALFGTPDEPYALPATNLNLGQLRRAAGPAWSDEAGYSYGLYRKHCVHCHGVTGDGRGPTALFLNPYPRDYRPGVYKFKSTYNPAKPTDDDLHRVLINGVPGTAMPSFSLLPGSEVEALVEYVKYLSYRGQLETKLIEYVFNELGEEEATDEAGNELLDDDGEPVMRRIPLDPTTDADQREAVLALLDEVLEGWNEANEQIIVPEEDSIPQDERSLEEILASAEKGRVLFYGVKANCVKCHGPTGLGDGQQDDHDSWMKAHKKFLEDTASMAKKSELDDYEQSLLDRREEVAESLYPLRNAIPRNLRQGTLRGGRRRLDVFHKVYAGIAGTPMPGSGPPSPGAKGTLTEEEMWNIVDYVLTLPYERASQPQRVTPKYTEAISR
jgi:mono/diheme cytochrome c family protein